MATATTTWCVCGRESKADPFEPCRSSLANKDAAVKWLKDHFRALHRQHGYTEFYLEREESEDPAELWAKTYGGIELVFELANGTAIDL